MDKNFNINVTNYANLRDYLRYFFIYGCYSREDFENIRDFSLRKYDSELRRFKEIFGEEYIKETIRGREKYVNLNYSYYNTVENYLAETFLVKSYTNLALSVFFNIYFVLWEEGNLTLNQLTEIIEGKISVERDIMSTIRRIAEDMVNKGLIEKKKVGSKIYYSNNLDIFRELEDEELKCLYTGVYFFSQIQYPISVGRYLRDTVYRYAKYFRNIDLNSEEEMFLFKYLGFQQIIDEEIVWKLERAIEDRIMVFVKYYYENDQFKSIKGYPIKILWNNNYGKWYLKLLLDNDNIICIEVEYILEVNELDKKVDEKTLSAISDSPEKEKLKEIKILFEVENFNKRNFLINKVRREMWNGKIELIDKDKFIYTTNLNDWKEIKPWIMSFGYRAKVIYSDEHTLYEEIKNEWIGMGELYGTVCGAKE